MTAEGQTNSCLRQRIVLDSHINLWCGRNYSWCANFCKPAIDWRFYTSHWEPGGIDPEIARRQLRQRQLPQFHVPWRCSSKHGVGQPRDLSAYFERKGATVPFSSILSLFSVRVFTHGSCSFQPAILYYNLWAVCLWMAMWDGTRLVAMHLPSGWWLLLFVHQRLLSRSTTGPKVSTTKRHRYIITWAGLNWVSDVHAHLIFSGTFCDCRYLCGPALLCLHLWPCVHREPLPTQTERLIIASHLGL